MFGFLSFIPAVLVASPPPQGIPPAAPASNLFFIENKGQWSSEAAYLLRSPGANYWVTRDGIVIDHQASRNVMTLDREGEPTTQAETFGHVVRIRAVGSPGSGITRGIEPREPKFSWMVGDTANWRNELRTFGSVVNEQILPGVAARYYIDGNAPRYDLIVAPGKNPESVELAYEGAQNLRVNADGSLQYETSVGTHRETGLFTYQLVNGQRKPVASRFIVKGNRVKFDLGAYDSTRPVVIDPQYFTYGTYFGGTNNEEAQSIDVLPNGDVVVAGYSSGANFPTSSGAYDTTYNSGSQDAFVSVFRGNQLRFSTFIGTSSSSTTVENDVRVLGGDNITLVFDTNGSLPTTTTANNGTTINLQNNGYKTTNNGIDPYVVKFRADLGQIRYATYIGGTENNEDWVEDITVDVNGDILVVGNIQSNGLATTVSGPGAAKASGSQDGFVMKLRGDLGSVRAATYLGGTTTETFFGITTTPSGRVYVAGRSNSSNALSLFSATGFDSGYGSGRDGLLYYLNPNLTVIRGTFLGGTGNDEFQKVVLSGGRVYAAGYVQSGSFWGTSPYPALSAVGGFDQNYGGGQEGFVVAYDDLLSNLRRFTYVGGASAASVERVDAIGAAGGRIYAAGTTDSASGLRTSASDTFFMTTSDALASTTGTRGFATLLGTDLNLINSTTFSAGSTEVRDLDITGIYNDVLVAGWTTSNSLPVSAAPNSPAYSSSLGGTRDGFLLRFAYSADPTEIRVSTANLASGNSNIFGNVFMNAPIAFARTRTITTSDSRLEVVTPTVTIDANQRLSSQFRLRRNGVFTSPTTVTVSVLQGSTVLLSRDVVVQP